MDTKQNGKNIFSEFTNLYSLSKTLRFELKPVGKTLDNIREHLGYDKNLQTFLKDQKIEDAYQTLKPILDQIHEKFITESLESDEARQIDFSDYFEKYKEKEDDKGEKDLLNAVGKTYEKGEKYFKNKYLSLKWKKGSKEAKGASILECQDIFEVIRLNYAKDLKIQEALDAFKGFFTYFGGFNQNRANYYETKTEKATAIATRIVHENLPKFCDNVILFDARKEEYLGMFNILKDLGKNLVTKEKKPILPADKVLFDISHIKNCLSQNQIEKYNEQIGNANFLINLYNQAKNKEAGFKKLPLLKTLYKQIGCGKKKALFFTLTHNTKKEAVENKENFPNPFSVEDILIFINKAGEKFFQGKKGTGIVETVQDFSEYILKKENYDGVYWSKAAMNTISNKYFANYHDLKDKLKEEKVFQKATKGNEEDVKIPEAIELSGLFAVLDKSENWQKALFKESTTKELEKTKGNEEENKKREKRRYIIMQSKTSSEALLKMIFSDIEENAKKFLGSASEILSLKEYKSKESTEAIKQWLDCALAINRMLKYFSVKENKVKGNSLDSNISEALKDIIFEAKLDDGTEVDWFKWYDALRNYLTKKPQDDAKVNKLKLNFENSTLAAGWDVNKEAANNCVILKDKEEKKYLAVMRRDCNKIFEKNWFDGRGKNKQSIKNPLFYENGDWLKMEYKQIATPTGIGGFVRKCFNTARQYGWQCPNDCLNNEGKIITKNEEAKNVLTKLIDCYKDFFEKYEKDGFKYKDYNFQFKPSNKYDNLHEFFGDVENQGYKISFVNVSKIELDKLVEEGKIYLFEIKNQDSNDGKKVGHKQNLHTIYWNFVFSKNTEKPKLNGKAELFYRSAVPVDKMAIVKDENGNELKNKKGKKVLKNYRFSKEKFLFHCSINLNYKAKNYSKPEYALREVNQHINDNFQNKEVCFLGIDRGEKHLAYYSLVDKKGRIIDQGTLNLPFTDKDGNRRTIKAEKRTLDKDGKEKVEIVECGDYNALLEARAGDRDYARKNWQTIGTIKELKEGYISQVVRKIADLAVSEEKPAFIVLEDLNTGFKRGRQKIEKSVYQKFELALAKKLNFLVDKKAKSGEIGSVTNAL